jgi:hypothetical protein
MVPAEKGTVLLLEQWEQCRAPYRSAALSVGRCRFGLEGSAMNGGYRYG